MKSYYKQTLSILSKLGRAYPKQTMGNFISSALDGSDLKGISNKDLFLLLKKYHSDLQTIPSCSDDELNIILKEGMHLHNIFEEDED